MTEVIIKVIGALLTAALIWGLKWVWTRFRPLPELPAVGGSGDRDHLDEVARDGAKRLLAEAMRREVAKRARGRD